MDIREFNRDDGLIEDSKRQGQPQLRVYCPEQTVVVLGRGSRPDAEVELDAVQEDGIQLLRRRGGGGSVVLDQGNVIVAVALPLAGIGQISSNFQRITNCLINALELAGISGVRRDGISDLVLRKRKIGGSCVYRTLGLLYYSATLLFDPSLELIERYLKHPPREPRYRERRSHRDFLGSLAEQLPTNNIQTFAESINWALSKNMDSLQGSNAPAGTRFAQSLDTRGAVA